MTPHLEQSESILMNIFDNLGQSKSDTNMYIDQLRLVIPQLWDMPKLKVILVAAKGGMQGYFESAT